MEVYLISVHLIGVHLNGPEGVPASTAPSRLAGGGTDTRGKRVKRVTKRYKEAREGPFAGIENSTPKYVFLDY
jgi:hypothetical protein